MTNRTQSAFTPDWEKSEARITRLEKLVFHLTEIINYTEAERGYEGEQRFLDGSMRRTDEYKSLRKEYHDDETN